SPAANASPEANTSPAANGSPAANASPAATASPASSGSPQGRLNGGAVEVQLTPAPSASASPAASASAAAPAASAPPNATFKKAIIRLGKKGGVYEPLTPVEISSLLTRLQGKLGRLTNPPLSIESNDPVIGKELLSSGLYALGIALILQLFYITFRFGNQWSYGIAADIALVHDIIIMVGFYILFNRQIDSPFLAALLTVIGYSVMDSIVIFDRIRENVKLNRKANFEETVNKSVNETMTRSINTLMTVLLCLFALYFFGEVTLRNFAFALLVGITSGGYSSIFIASPILVVWDKKAKLREAEMARERRVALVSQPKASSAGEEKAVEEEEAEEPDTTPTQNRRPTRRRSGARRRR
ncbi:MAG: protein translocase subunit SecF, partial [Candidatus Xenobia bacterium]